MSISTHRFGIARCNQRRPGLSIISRAEKIWSMFAEGMTIEGRVSCAGVEINRLHPTNPGILGQPGNISDHVRPGLGTIARDLHIAIIGSDPDNRFVL